MGASYRFSQWVLILLLSLPAFFVLQASAKETPDALTQVFPWDSAPFRHTYEVTSIADSGPETLREAITEANAATGLDLIVFTSADDIYQQPRTIALDAPLPPISDALVIDGYIEDMLWKPSGITLDGGAVSDFCPSKRILLQKSKT